MPGLEGDLEEWQTQQVNVTRGEAEGDIDLEGLPFLKVTRNKFFDSFTCLIVLMESLSSTKPLNVSFCKCCKSPF